jgi:hypothetical protein
MFKKSIITLLFLAAIGYVSAQTLQFEWDGNVFYEGEAIECTNDEYGYGEFIQHMQLRNLTSNDMNVIIEKEVLEDLEGTINSFCWGMCYGPDTYVSPEAVTVLANSLNTDDLSFHNIYEPEIFGYVVVRYYAYDEHNPDERVSIIVKFHKSGDGVDDNAQFEMSQAYPNPATSTVNFDYSFSGNLTAVVYNIVGQEVLRKDLNTNNGQMSISVADLNDGIYFCTMLVDGCASATQKFVVKK